MADLERRQSDGFRKSREILNELKQLKIKISTFERERSIFSNRIVSDLLLPLKTEEAKLEKKRQVEKLELKQKIIKIRHKVSHLQRTLKDTSQTNPSSVEKVKEMLEDIETSIATFKEKQKKAYEELLQQEVLVWQEVMAHKRIIESWATTTGGGGASKVTEDTSHVTTRKDEEGEDGMRYNRPLAVTEFQSFLHHRGGHTGGWEEIDQNIFIKLWNKHKGVEESLLEEAIREIPSHSPESISHHISWYNEYCTLRDANKSAVNEWRQQKEVERKRAVGSEASKEKKKEEEEKKLAIKEKLKEKEREEKKKKLELWKQEQLSMKLAEEKREELRKQNELLKEKRKQDRQALIKRQAQEYCQMKEEEKRKKELIERTQAEVQRERSKEANKHIQRFQQRDKRTLLVKKELLASHQLERDLKKAQLDKIKETVAVKVERDPSRLLRPTSVWMERQKTADHITSSVPLVTIPKRATPSWRQNL